MTPKTLERVPTLSPTQRDELVALEWENYVDFDIDDDPVVDVGLTEEQIAELRRRSAEAKAHPELGIPWSEVKRKLDALIAGE